MNEDAISFLRWAEGAFPRIRFAGRFPLPLTAAELGGRTREYLCRTVALHQHDYSAVWSVRGQRLELRPGDVTITPANEPNWYELPKFGHHLCVHFDAAPAREPAASLPLLTRPGADAPGIAVRLQRITSLHRQSQHDAVRAAAASRAASGELQALLLWLAWFSAAEQPGREPIPEATDQALERLRQVLDARYRETWTAAALRREAQLSPNYLARMFRRKFGMTIQRYLLQRRIDCARHLLATTSEPLKQIASECGLGTPQYFSRRFRAIAGITPSSARRQLI